MHRIIAFSTLEGTFKDNLVPTSTAMGKNSSHETILFQVPFKLAVSTSRDRAPTSSLGNPFLYPITLTAKNFLLTSNLNLPSFSLKTTSCPVARCLCKKSLPQLSHSPLLSTDLCLVKQCQLFQIISSFSMCFSTVSWRICSMIFLVTELRLTGVFFRPSFFLF